MVYLTLKTDATCLPRPLVATDGLSAESRSRFGPHPFDRETVYGICPGGRGRLSDDGGKAISQWVLSNAPDFKPKRILDVGCGLGHNPLPLATAFQQWNTD